MRAIVCPNCGAPLPPEASAAAQLTCAFCSIHLSRAAERFEVVEGSVGKPAAEERMRRRAAFGAAIGRGLEGEGSPREVLVQALREHFGLGDESETVATIALGLAAEFRKKTGADVTRDAVAVARLAEAYLGAVEELGVSASSEIDMPYFASSAQGPIHFRRELTVADIRILAGDVPAEPPAPKPAHRPRELQAAPLNAGSAEEPAAPPKRWWWPF